LTLLPGGRRVCRDRRFPNVANAPNGPGDGPNQMRLEHILSFIVSVIVFGFVLYSSRSTAKGKSRATHKQKPASLRLEPQAQLHRRLWKAIKWAITTGVAVFAFLAVVDQFWGRPWPTDPEIHPHDTLNGSSLRLPFTIKNKSLFDYSNVEMTCGIDWAYFKDARLTKGTLNAIAFVNQTLLLPAEQQINYQCDASQLIRINRDGSWSIRSLELCHEDVETSCCVRDEGRPFGAAL
jgi:hypothetical protein